MNSPQIRLNFRLNVKLKKLHVTVTLWKLNKYVLLNLKINSSSRIEQLARGATLTFELNALGKSPGVYLVSSGRNDVMSLTAELGSYIPLPVLLHLLPYKLWIFFWLFLRGDKTSIFRIFRFDNVQIFLPKYADLVAKNILGFCMRLKYCNLKKKITLIITVVYKWIRFVHLFSAWLF